jgi:hypothetical protein
LSTNHLSRPSDGDFAQYFRQLLNPENQHHDLTILSSGVHIPVLDADIQPGEVIDQIKKQNPQKAAGVDGIPPGVLKWLSDDWILLLTFIMNTVFNGTYPASWCLSKIFVIFKTGLLTDPNNYRGISITDALPKLYDGILNARFGLWYRPCCEQAGAQVGRGCEEQIVTLRLYIDIARRKGFTLYLLFIDYIKAYDKVNRNQLLRMLCDQGCGDRFLSAVGKGLMDNFGVIGDAQFKYSNGVKQGSSTSCSLFTFYLDQTVRAVSTHMPDGFLKDNHILLLMDDTVLLATSRTAMMQKLRLLHASASNIGMLIHPGKSRYLVVNSDDREPFMDEDIQIKHCSQYMYLGALISTGNTVTQVEKHLKFKQGNIYTYQSFIHRNQNAPYSVKRTVLLRALQPALLHSCESWLTSDVRCIDTAINSCIKSLLGVRTQTSNDSMYIESGISPASSVIKDRQNKFYNKLHLHATPGNPVHVAIRLAKDIRSPMGIYLDKMDTTKDNSREAMDNIRLRVQSSTSTRLQTYTFINPDCDVHPVYQISDICEYARINFTRLRLSSHYLRIETGR